MTQLCKHNRLTTAIIAIWAVSCAMFPKASSHDWEENGRVILSFLSLWQNFQSNGPLADFRMLTWKTILAQAAIVWAVFCKWNCHDSVKWTGFFFNPQLFDLIRPICICSRAMVRMKATAVIAFSRRHRFPHPLCSHCTVITPALSLCNHLHLPLMLL